MGLTPDVVSGQTKILASWGNEIRDRTVQVFDTAAQRTSQLAAPYVGQLTSLATDPGKVWSWDGANWQPLLVSHAGTRVLTTNAFGNYVYTYPTPFQTKPYVVVCDGDANTTPAGSCSIHGLMNSQETTTYFGGVAFDFNGNPKPNTTLRINFVATVPWG